MSDASEFDDEVVQAHHDHDAVSLNRVGLYNRPASETSSITRNNEEISARTLVPPVSPDSVDGISQSTADEGYSHPRSIESVVESEGTVSSITRAAQRSYLSPLRSKRYDGIRSSLLSPAATPRTGFLFGHSRTSSATSMLRLSELAHDDVSIDPQDFMKWSKLRKITEQLYSESGKKAFGSPTCLIVSGILAIGTSKGLVLIYNYQQNCKHVLGNGTTAIQAGPVTAIAISADHTFVATGHDNGSIFSWDLSKPNTIAKTIIPCDSKATTTKRGHLDDTRITHLSFVGYRHSAFVSADSQGMVFYHNFNRKLLISNVESSRILGRYPEDRRMLSLKPSVVYSSAVLPLGNTPDVTDSMGLVAVLTPYRLVIVSTSPIIRTQFRMSRPSGLVAEASDISGCAAWYPVIKNVNSKSGQLMNAAKCPVLAFAWCRQLFLAEVQGLDLAPSQETSRPKVSETSTTVSKCFTCSESIVAIQWHTSDTLCLFTKSNRLLFIDTTSHQVTGQCDLIQKQVLHYDTFAEVLHSYFLQRESEYVDQSFAGSYTYSYQAYKGKFFLLGAHDISIGSVLTWSDKLLSLTSDGQYVEGISLLVKYYTGETPSNGSGLPADVLYKKSLLAPKICESILSGVRYSLASEDLAIRSDQYHARLLAACFQACIVMKNVPFLLYEVYDTYSDASRTEPFITILADHILHDSISSITPIIAHDLTQQFLSEKLYTRLEDIICHLEPAVLDIHWILKLCKTYSLYNASVHVHTEAMQDFVTPLVEFFELIKNVMKSTHLLQGDVGDQEMQKLGVNTVNAVKIFSFVSNTMNGRTFPLAKAREQPVADLGREQVLDVLFAGGPIFWPLNSQNMIATGIASPEPTFPYLRLLLLFDCPTFLASMDEAFEDSCLNESLEVDGTLDMSKRFSITRQFIINILLEVMNTDSEDEDIIYLYMFIARNIPKYPQFIVLSGSVLQKVLVGLCEFTDPDLADDCQLCVECLLSVYKPTNHSQMVALYQQAGFFRVLTGLYRAEGKWPELLRAHLRDEESAPAVFECLQELLGPRSALSVTQRAAVQDVLLEHIVSIASLDGLRAADVINRCVPQLRLPVFEALLSREGLLFIYLKRSLSTEASTSSGTWATQDVVEKYIDLLCIYDRDLLLDYLKSVSPDHINVDRVIENLEKYGFTDAIITLMERQGRREEALQHILGGIRKLDNVASEDHAIEQNWKDLRGRFQHYAALGASLCEADIEPASTGDAKRRSPAITSVHTERNEKMWNTLLAALVHYQTRVLLRCEQDVVSRSRIPKLQLQLQSVLQATFSRLLVSTYSKSPVSTIRILRHWLHDISVYAHETSNVQPVLRTVFDTYRYYRQLLALAKDILGKDLFLYVSRGTQAHAHGWRVKQSECSICHERIYDAGLIGHDFRAFRRSAKQARDERRAKQRTNMEVKHGLRSLNGGKASVHGSRKDEEPALSAEFKAHPMTLVSYSCGHITHETCYRGHQTNNDEAGMSCPQCATVASSSTCDDNVEQS